jgi:CTD nuclear envelope phosphatase 1
VHGDGKSMNALTAFANLGTPPPSPARSRAGSESNVVHPLPRPSNLRPSNDASADITDPDEKGDMGAARGASLGRAAAEAPASEDSEKTPLLNQPSEGNFEETKTRRRWLYPKRISQGIVGAVGVLLAPFVYTGQYVVACFYYEEDGRFSLLAPVYHVARTMTRSRRKKAGPRKVRPSKSSASNEKARRASRGSSSTMPEMQKTSRRSLSVASTSTAMTSDSESERPTTRDDELDSPSRHTRSKSSIPLGGDEIAPAKRSIRIKLHNEDALRQRKAAKKEQVANSGSGQVSPEAAAALKSPTGPIKATSKQLTKFPRAPQPPRPLVPRRQPSYSASGTSAVGPHQKTLIIDLDETLIHSQSKGGRFQTGRMVEVKLQASVGAGGQIIGPQVPILYYVHKRPYCDDFLKKVCGPACVAVISLTPWPGQQMVQPRHFHRVGAGVCRPCHRLAGSRAQVLRGTLLQAALHVPQRSLHQRSCSS